MKKYLIIKNNHMKKTLIVSVILSVILISCNEKKDKVMETTVKEMENEKEKIVHEENIINNNWVNEIQLNNNSKWDANIETTQGVDAMLKYIDESNPETVENYLALANELNDEKNLLVKECTMTGPSHDNLHIFLHPLIEKINHLSKTSSIEEGSEITKSINENLVAYKNYFN